MPSLWPVCRGRTKNLARMSAIVCLNGQGLWVRCYAIGLSLQKMRENDGGVQPDQR